MKKIFLFLLCVMFAGCAGMSPGEKSLKDLMEEAEGTGADQKLSALDAYTTAPDTDDLIYFVLYDGDVTYTSKKMTAPNFFKYLETADIPVKSSRYDCEDLADDTYEGETFIVDCGDADGCAVGDIVFIDPSDADPLKEADATVSSGEFPAFGIVVVAGADGSPTVVMTKGCYRDDSAYNWTITASTDFIYLGESDGTSTQTAPSTSGDCIQIIGYPISADVAHYDFTRPFLEVE